MTKEKQPRVPNFNLSAAKTAKKLQAMIDARDENSILAYRALTRLSVINVDNLSVGDPESTLNELLVMMTILFPTPESLL